jgi:hypothetical protein
MLPIYFEPRPPKNLFLHVGDVCQDLDDCLFSLIVKWRQCCSELFQINLGFEVRSSLKNETMACQSTPQWVIIGLFLD